MVGPRLPGANDLCRELRRGDDSGRSAFTTKGKSKLKTESELQTEYNAARRKAQALIDAKKDAAGALNECERIYSELLNLRHHAWGEQIITDIPRPTFANFVGGNDPTATDEYARRFHREIVLERGQHVSSELLNAQREFYAANAESTDTGGGYLVPAQILNQILRRLPALSPLLGLVHEFPASSDRVVWPRARRNTTSGYGSIYTSAFVGTFVPEVPSATAGENEPIFGEFDITINKARALAIASQDFVEDAGNFVSFLTEDGAANMALLREYAIIAGTGKGSEPLGITNMPTASSSPTEEQILTVDIEGTTVDTISNTHASLGSANKLLDLYYSRPGQYRRQPSCAWVMNSATEKAIRKLTDAQGRYLWSVEGMLGDPANGLLGKPVQISEFMPSDGTNGNTPIIFGDWSQVLVPVRRALQLQIANERYIDTDQIGFFLRQRFGVGVPNRDAFRLGIV